jgi:hypothetical protein
MYSLRQNFVIGHEIFAGKGKQLAVARMVHGFHPGHLADDIVVVGVDVLDQLELGMPTTIRISATLARASTAS